jgi:predicted phage gp36 major capsid-like protein
MIELCQDVEMQFEDKKQQERKVHNSLQSMVDKLRANEKANDDKIKKTIKEKDAIMGVHDDGDGKGIESSD